MPSRNSSDNILAKMKQRRKQLAQRVSAVWKIVHFLRSIVVKNVSILRSRDPKERERERERNSEILLNLSKDTD